MEAEQAAQNPSVHGLGRTSATNPLGRMSMSKPTTEQLEKASVVKMQHSDESSTKSIVSKPPVLVVRVFKIRQFCCCLPDTQILTYFATISLKTCSTTCEMCTSKRWAVYSS